MTIQGTPEWFAARLGKVTASRVADATARTKTGWGASRANYMAELLTERLTGQSAPRYENAAMQWGTATEPEARLAYEFEHACDVVEVGFVDHPAIAMTGASPDGLVGDDGLVEIKCPNSATHIETLLGGEVDPAYLKQMQWQMACTGRKWCDWISYDPRLPVSMRLFVKRVHRDDAMIEKLAQEISAFLFELETKLTALTKRYEEKAAA